jgi:hypothetical protein
MNSFTRGSRVTLHLGIKGLENSQTPHATLHGQGLISSLITQPENFPTRELSCTRGSGVRQKRGNPGVKAGGTGGGGGNPGATGGGFTGE